MNNSSIKTSQMRVVSLLDSRFWYRYLVSDTQYRVFEYFGILLPTTSSLCLFEAWKSETITKHDQLKLIQNFKCQYKPNTSL